MKSHTATINAPTAPVAFFYFLFLFSSFYDEDGYDKNVFEKKISQATVKNDLKKIEFTGRELSFNSLTIY